MSYIEELINKNRLFEVLNDELMGAPFYSNKLYNIIKNYTEHYIRFSQKEGAIPRKMYIRFIRSYNKDLVRFLDTGKYPLELGVSHHPPSRLEYNIILLFSCLFTPHRFRIMQLIWKKSINADNGLVIGCGPGLEIELVKARIQKLCAYDLTFDNFLKAKHPDISFYNTYFDGNTPQKYNSIYLIELLEHLKDPFELLRICKNCMSTNGKIYLTTATNIPQFDHLYNFEPSHKEFEEQIRTLGFKIDFMEEIIHQTLTINVDAKNRFYILSSIS